MRAEVLACGGICLSVCPMANCVTVLFDAKCSWYHRHLIRQCTWYHRHLNFLLPTPRHALSISLKLGGLCFRVMPPERTQCTHFRVVACLCFLIFRSFFFLSIDDSSLVSLLLVNLQVTSKYIFSSFRLFIYFLTCLSLCVCLFVCCLFICLFICSFFVFSIHRLSPVTLASNRTHHLSVFY